MSLPAGAEPAGAEPASTPEEVSMPSPSTIDTPTQPEPSHEDDDDTVEFEMDKLEIRAKPRNGQGEEVFNKVPLRKVIGTKDTKYIVMVLDNPIYHDRKARPLGKAPLNKKGKPGRWSDAFRNLWLFAKAVCADDTSLHFPAPAAPEEPAPEVDPFECLVQLVRAEGGHAEEAAAMTTMAEDTEQFEYPEQDEMVEDYAHDEEVTEEMEEAVMPLEAEQMNAAVMWGEEEYPDEEEEPIEDMVAAMPSDNGLGGFEVPPTGDAYEKELAELRGVAQRPIDFGPMPENLTEEAKVAIENLARAGQKYTLPDHGVTATFDPNFEPEEKKGYVSFDKALDSCKEHAAGKGYALVIQRSGSTAAHRKLYKKRHSYWNTKPKPDRLDMSYNAMMYRKALTNTRSIPERNIVTIACDKQGPSTTAIAPRNKFRRSKRTQCKYNFRIEFYEVLAPSTTHQGEDVLVGRWKVVHRKKEDHYEHNHAPHAAPSVSKAQRDRIYEKMCKATTVVDFLDVVMEHELSPSTALQMVRSFSPEGYHLTYDDIYNRIKDREKNMLGGLSPMQAFVMMLQGAPDNFFYNYRVKDVPPPDPEETANAEDGTAGGGDSAPATGGAPPTTDMPGDKTANPPEINTDETAGDIPPSEQDPTPTNPTEKPNDGDTDTKPKYISDVFFIHTATIPYLRAYPEIMALDCTYNTNSNNMRLLNIVGVDGCNKSFPIANAYISREDEDTYTWALQQLRDFMEKHAIPVPDTMLSDCCAALMNALAKVFPAPRTTAKLCRWHLHQAFLRKSKMLFRTKKKNGDEKDSEDREAFMNLLWKQMTNATTPEGFDNAYNQFVERFGKGKWRNRNARVENLDTRADTEEREKLRKYSPLNYLKFWFGKNTNTESGFKDKIVSYLIDEANDFFNITTSRVEGIHAHYKRFMRTRKLSLFASAKVLIRTNLGLFANLNHHHAMEGTTAVIDINYDLYDALQRRFSTKALEKVFEEYNKSAEGITAEDVCSGTYESKNKLPCRHTINEICKRRADGQFSIGDIHPHWRLFHMTKQMSRDDWDSACSKGKYAADWEDLKKREDFYNGAMPARRRLKRTWDALDSDIVDWKQKDTVTPDAQRGTARAKNLFEKGGRTLKTCHVCPNVTTANYHTVTKDCYKRRWGEHRWQREYNQDNTIKRAITTNLQHINPDISGPLTLVRDSEDGEDGPHVMKTFVRNGPNIIPRDDRNGERTAPDVYGTQFVQPSTYK